MADEPSRTYSDYEDDGNDYGRMDSVSNSGAEDGAPEAEKMDAERNRHGKVSAKQDLSIEDGKLIPNFNSFQWFLAFLIFFLFLFRGRTTRRGMVLVGIEIIIGFMFLAISTFLWNGDFQAQLFVAYAILIFHLQS